jgi:hypothetical protein
VPAPGAERLDVRAGRLGHPQPVQREQGHQGLLGRRAEPGGDQQPAEFVAVQPGGVRVVIQPGPADMGGRGVIQQLFLDGVLVEPGDRAQPARDRGPGTAPGLQIPGEALDVRPAGNGQPDTVLVAPVSELAQV